MTAKLLPIYLQCFEDSYVSVRKEACIAATNLKISDEQVLQHLINLATYDPIWTIKALAIQGLCSHTVKGCFPPVVFRYLELKLKYGKITHI